MTRVIHKYPLQLTTNQQIEVPVGSILRACQIQDGKICMWTEGPIEFEELGTIEVMIVGTGQHFDTEDYKFIMTVQLDGMVWHIYMREV